MALSKSFSRKQSALTMLALQLDSSGTMGEQSYASCKSPEKLALSNRNLTDIIDEEIEDVPESPQVSRSRRAVQRVARIARRYSGITSPSPEVSTASTNKYTFEAAVASGKAGQRTGSEFSTASTNKYTFEAAVASDKAQQRKDDMKARRRARMEGQRLRRQKEEEEEEKLRLMQESKARAPKPDVQWVFKFMGKLHDTRKKQQDKVFLESLSPKEQILLKKFRKLKIRWFPVFDELLVRKNFAKSRRKQLGHQAPAEGKRIDNRPTNVKDTGRRLKLTALANVSHTPGDHGDDNNEDTFRVKTRRLFEALDARGKGYLDLMDFKRLWRQAAAHIHHGDDIDGRTRFLKHARADFKVLDTDGDHGVSFEEFFDYCLMMKRFNSPPPGTPAPATHAPNLEPAMRTYDARHEEICIGGLPPIVVAATEGDLELVVTLADQHYDSVLSQSEKEAIVNAAKRGDVERTRAIVRDLFTRQTQRKYFIDSMIDEDLGLARDRLKELYYNPVGAHLADANKMINGAAFRHGNQQEPREDVTEHAENGPFHYLTGTGHIRHRVKHEGPPEPITVTRQMDLGRKLLNACGQRSSMQVVNECIADGANVNFQDKNKSTALMAAAWFGKEKIADVLLSHGASATHTNRRGNTAMHFVAEKNNTALLYLFLRHGGAPALKVKNLIGRTPIAIFKDAYLEDVATAALTLAEGDTHAISQTVYGKQFSAHKDGYLGKGDDMMRSACQKGDTRALRYLLKTGLADTTTADKFGITPLMHACYYGKVKAVQFLLENGATAASQTFAGGNTAMHFAFQQQQMHKGARSKKYQNIIKTVLSHDVDNASALMAVVNKKGQLPYEDDVPGTPTPDTKRSPKKKRSRRKRPSSAHIARSPSTKNSSFNEGRGLAIVTHAMQDSPRPSPSPSPGIFRPRSQSTPIHTRKSRAFKMEETRQRASSLLQPPARQHSSRSEIIPDKLSLSRAMSGGWMQTDKLLV